MPSESEIMGMIARQTSTEQAQQAYVLGVSGSFDVNGVADALILDADADTTISAPTDDQIDIEVAGADDFTITANSFNVLTGSAIDLADSCQIKLGTGDDITIAWDGTDLDILQATPDSSIKWGVDAAGIDQVWYGDTTAVNMTWDQTANSLIFADSGLLVFGTGSDVTVRWDGTDLDILAAADDSVIKIGTGTNSFDLWVYGNTANDNIIFSAANNPLNLDGIDLQLEDADILSFGDADDVTVKWDGTRLVASALANPMWDDCPSPLDPNYRSQCFEYFDDFTGQYDTTATVGNWKLTSVGTGTPLIADNVPGGQLVLTCQATTDDAAHQVVTTNDQFFLAAGKTLWFETRIKITGDVQSEHSFGLIAESEDLVAVADVLPQDGISFSTQDATLAAALTCSKNGTDTGAVAGVHTLVTGTWVTLGFKVDGVTSVTPYVNGVAGTPATATICDDESLAPYFLVRNGDATTQQILAIDYVRVVQLR